MRCLKLVTPFVLVCLLVACKARGPAAKTLSGPDEKELSCLFGMAKNAPAQMIRDDLVDYDVLRIAAANMEASFLAYDSDEEIQRKARAWGFTLTRPFHVGSMSGYIATNDQCAVLAFRGTNDFPDFLRDIDILKATTKHGTMHSGFFNSWMELSKRVKFLVELTRAQDKVFWVTGHSLGGALAGVYAYFAELDGLDKKTIVNRYAYDPKKSITRVMTFGQPLFADHDLAAAMREHFLGRYTRIVNETDLIARVPKRFEHFGTLLWFRDRYTEYFLDRVLAQGESDSISILPAEIPPELEANDQAMELYADFLRKQAETPPAGPDRKSVV